MSEENPPHAVVVDDNLMFAMMIEPQLKRLGYTAKTLSGGPETADAVARSGAEVVFVNLTSARYSGEALIRELRARPELAETGIVGYAGHVERDFLQAGLAAGADLTVPNSAVPASLAEVLAKLKRRRSDDSEPQMDADQRG